MVQRKRYILDEQSGFTPGGDSRQESWHWLKIYVNCRSLQPTCSRYFRGFSERIQQDMASIAHQKSDKTRLSTSIIRWILLCYKNELCSINNGNTVARRIKCTLELRKGQFLLPLYFFSCHYLRNTLPNSGNSSFWQMILQSLLWDQ